MLRNLILLFALSATLSVLGAESNKPNVPQDTVTLDDGTILKGKLLKEEDGKFYFKVADGETSVIDKIRVRRMEIVAPPRLADPANPGMAAKGAPGPAIAPRNANASKQLDPEWAKPRLEVLAGLGASDLATRQTTLEKIQDAREEYLLVMMAMLAPGMKTDEWTRIGILRAMLSMGPLTDDAARTLAFDAIHDPYPEARREACRTVRYLQDDRALRDLMRYATIENNAILRQASANALHEIDDNRMYGALVSAIPTPQVVSNVSDPTGLDKPKYRIPTGPGGMSVPLFLPSASIMGVASDIGGPIPDFLKMIARKDLGNMPYAWLIWYREKIGDIGKDERDAYKEHRHMSERMGVSP